MRDCRGIPVHTTPTPDEERNNFMGVPLPVLGTEACFDVSEAFPISKLSKGHTEILIETSEMPDLVVPMVSLNATSKRVNG